MATNEILPFAQGVGANVQSQVDYLAEPLRSSGNVAGIARSAVNNKALRQASLMASALAQFIADNQANDVVDTETPANISGWLESAVQSFTTDFLNTTRIDVASASVINLTSSAPNTRHINITGTTAITGFTVAAGQCYFVRFAGALTLTNGAGLVTQSGANITTTAGDTCIIRATADNVVEVLAYSRVQRFTQSATINTTSGTSHDVTGIPSWVRRITLILSGVSLNLADQLLVQVGAGSVLTTGYTANAGSYDAGSGALSSTNGFVIRTVSAAGLASLSMTLYRVSGNEWLSTHVGSTGTGTGTSTVCNGGGVVTLSGELDRVRLTSVTGTSVFDAGKLTVQYEG